MRAVRRLLTALKYGDTLAVLREIASAADRRIDGHN